MRLFLILAGAAAAGCAAPPAAVTIVEAGGEAEGCALAVSFGSYAMGIDRDAAGAVEQAIMTAPGVAAVTRHRWGREGEYTLCVDTGTPAAAERLFGRLSALLPAAPRGPIELRLADGRTRRAPPA